MPGARVFPDMDIDLEQAVRRVAAALIPPAGRKAARLRASDVEVFDALDRVVDIMTDPASAPESAALAFALYLLWPRTGICLSRSRPWHSEGRRRSPGSSKPLHQSPRRETLKFRRSLTIV
jgi:hypothetical protein